MQATPKEPLFKVLHMQVLSTFDVHVVNHLQFYHRFLIMRVSQEPARSK